MGDVNAAVALGLRPFVLMDLVKVGIALAIVWRVGRRSRALVRLTPMTADAAALRAGIRRILYGPYGLRAGWRILGFVLLSAGAGMVLATSAAIARAWAGG